MQTSHLSMIKLKNKLHNLNVSWEINMLSFNKIQRTSDFIRIRVDNHHTRNLIKEHNDAR